MKTNKELTLSEFHIANNIKRAMLHIETNPDYAKSFLMAALRVLSDPRDTVSLTN